MVVASGRRWVCHSVAFLTTTRGDSRHARSAQMVVDRAGLSTDRRLASIRALSPLTFATSSKRLSYYLSSARYQPRALAACKKAFSHRQDFHEHYSNGTQPKYNGKAVAGNCCCGF